MFLLIDYLGCIFLKLTRYYLLLKDQLSSAVCIFECVKQTLMGFNIQK